MLREAKSLRYLSTTTFRGGFAGIGTKGSMTYEKVVTNLNSHLRVDVCHALPFLAVEALVNLLVSEVVLSQNLPVLVHQRLHVCFSAWRSLSGFCLFGRSPDA